MQPEPFNRHSYKVLKRKLPDNWDECLPKLTEEDAGKAGIRLEALNPRPF